MINFDKLLSAVKSRSTLLAMDEPLDLSLRCNGSVESLHKSPDLSSGRCSSSTAIVSNPGHGSASNLCLPSSTSSGSNNNNNNKKTYSQADLEAAVNDIRCGKLGTRRASVVYGIPRSTLRNKIYKLEASSEESSAMSGVGTPQGCYNRKKRRRDGESTPPKLNVEAGLLPATSDSAAATCRVYDPDEELAATVLRVASGKNLTSSLSSSSSTTTYKPAVPPPKKPMIGVSSSTTIASPMPPPPVTSPICQSTTAVTSSTSSANFLNDLTAQINLTRAATALWGLSGGGGGGETNNQSVSALAAALMSPFSTVSEDRQNSPSGSHNPLLDPSVALSLTALAERLKLAAAAALSSSSSAATAGRSTPSPKMTGNNNNNGDSKNSVAGANLKMSTSSPSSSSSLCQSGGGGTISSPVKRKIKSAVARSAAAKGSIALSDGVAAEENCIDAFINKRSKVDDDSEVPVASTSSASDRDAGGEKRSSESADSTCMLDKKNRPKRGQYRRYEKSALAQAVLSVRKGEMSVHRAGSYYGVPHSTLEYKVKERNLLRPRKRDLVQKQTAQQAKEKVSFVVEDVAAQIIKRATPKSEDEPAETVPNKDDSPKEESSQKSSPSNVEADISTNI